MECDVIVGWMHGPNCTPWMKYFTRPTRYVLLDTPAARAYEAQINGLSWGCPKQPADGKPHPLCQILNRAGIDRPLRVALVGFSETCSGVWRVLRTGDGANFDTVYACDGMHGGVPYYVAYGALANQGDPRYAPGRRQLIVTHSAIKPPGVPSTTETAAEVIGKLFPAPTGGGLEALPAAFTASHSPPRVVHVSGKDRGGIPDYNVQYDKPNIRYAVVERGVTIIGYNNTDKRGYADHIYQASTVAETVVRDLIAERWNNNEPTSGTCMTVA